ncbi:uncharacterized protein LOC143376016 [Andrena cerasifolii]|uniref:uncharacterized protein LOC143376016 n=1 Tax=Andrena cerasifolii TaxID=2819439 RepID=UPI004037EBE1
MTNLDFAKPLLDQNVALKVVKNGSKNSETRSACEEYRSYRPCTQKEKCNREGSTFKKGKTADKMKLKRWLQTPADWARFNAWVKINAQPKEIPEPEPIVRRAKPLSQLRRRIKLLSEPRKAPDLSAHCRDWILSKAALNAVASRRLILLALPNVRLVDYGRVFYKVSPAALRYQASQRIIDLAQPCVILPEECRPRPQCRQMVDEERLRKLALAKKLRHCPEELTPEEIAEVFTPHGIKRTALLYEITPWMEFLALPPYTTLKDRRDRTAVAWKRILIEEGDERGKGALVQQRKRRERELRKARKRKYKDMECDEISQGEGDTRKSTKGIRRGKKDEGEEKMTEDEERKAKRRRLEKHAWRFAPNPCKDDPNRIPGAALKVTASPRLETLAKPTMRESKAIRANPFGVSKGALSAAASPRTDALAKPPRPRSPVERKPPREKDEYGAPIFEKPVYGKVLPKTKPYKMGECPPPEEKKKAKIKKRPIDPIAYERTIDPCIYPDLARRQRRERKRVEKLSGRRGGRRRRQRGKRLAPEKTDGTPKADDKREEESDVAEAEETEPQETQAEETQEA